MAGNTRMAGRAGFAGVVGVGVAVAAVEELADADACVVATGAVGCSF